MRILGFVLLSVLMGAVPVAAQTAAAQPATDQITFHRDIEPILQRSCQRCHNPESIAPMSLITYEQVRPFARAMKQRTALARSPWSRGSMPPWFLEKTIGIQQIKDDVSLSDAEIAMIGKWADAGAPRGNPADAPPPLKILGAGEWTLGQPDLVVSTPKVYVSAVASDWSGTLEKTPIGIYVDRYARSAEFMETRDIKMGNATKNLNNRFVFHHMTTNVTGPDTVNEEGEESEDNTQSTSLPIHEVGRNGDVFPDDAGKLLPANGSISWGAHIHASGLPGSESYSRLHIGFRLHPEGYLPKRQIRGIQFGRSQLQVDGGKANNRDDAYKVLPQAMKIWNYEPHMHANGVRMCLQAIYGRAVETLNCAGYDHNWVRNYIYEENFQPILPKGTILHAVGWFDGTSRNENLPDPRNTATFGNGSLGNMFIVFNLAEFLTDEEYVEEVKKRKEFMKANPGVEMIGCPACFLPTPDPEPKKPASTNQTLSVPTAAPATGGTN